MSGIATAIVGSAIIGGITSSNAASSAADAQTAASDKASATQLAMYNQNRTDQEPWRNAGVTALGQLTKGTAAGGDFNRDFSLSDFTKDPGYDFRMREGQRGLDSSAAARGGALSGAAIKASERYNQDYASGEYQNAYNRYNADRTARFNRLSSLAGTGQTATNQVAADGSNTANSIAQNQIGSGNAQASSYIGQGNAVSGTLNTLGNYAMNSQYMNAGTNPYAARNTGVSNGVQLTDGTMFYN
jgi:hypothetical protein